MSITLIDKSKPLPPKFSYDKWAKNKPDKNASILDKDRFWEKEMEYWRTGRNGISGMHYAYMTIGSLKVIEGNVIKARWRDWDETVINLGIEARKKGQHEIIVKRREYGLSSLYGGFCPIFTSLINHGSVSLLTSADKPRVEGLFNDKTLEMYYGLDDHIRPNRISKRQGGYLHMGQVNKATGKPGGINSQIICRETADSDNNAKAFESYRAMYIFLDELFRHDRADMVLKSSIACMSKGLSTIGHLVMGGSCGEMTAKGAEVGERLWNDAAALNMQTIFIPGYACIEEADELDSDGRPTGKKLNFCVNGHSDEKAATDWILKTRERLAKAKDKSYLDTFVVQYPLTSEEVFDSNKRGTLSDNIYNKLKESKRKKNEGTFVEGVYDLFRENGKVIARPNSKTGKFYIASPPNDHGEYIAGGDPIPFGTAQIDKGSDFSGIIKDRINEKYVAHYTERNLNSDEVINNMIMLQELYRSPKFPDGALMNYEMNRGAVVLEKYKQFGKLHLLSDRLVHLGIAYESKHALKGWYNNDKTGQRANNYMIEYLERFADNIPIERLVEELFKWPNGNLDLVDAMLSCELLDKELTEMYKKVYKPVQRQKVKVFTRDADGRTIVKYV